MQAETGQSSKKKTQRGIAVKTSLHILAKELQSLITENLCVTQRAVTVGWKATSICLANESLRTHMHTHLLHGLHGWWWILVAAEVNDDPGNIAEEGYGDWWVDERKQGLDHAQRDDIIPALWTITWAAQGRGQHSSEVAPPQAIHAHTY